MTRPLMWPLAAELGTFVYVAVIFILAVAQHPT